jgi:ATPase family associated with various cellular activities (AAA)
MGFTNYAVLTAAFSGIAMFWGQVKGFFDRISSFVVVTVDLQSDAGDMFMQYAWKNYKRSSAAQRRFTAYSQFIRPYSKYGIVPFEMSGKALTFWSGWKPIFVSAATDKDGDFTGSVKITFLRGLFDIDKLMIESAKQVNHDHHSNPENTSRYTVKKIFGKNKRDGDESPSGRFSQSVNDSSHIHSQSNIPVGFTKDQLGASVAKIPFGTLSYPDNIKDFISEVRRWRDSEAWFKEKNIPWRFGAGLFGLPGSGKTSLVRATAQELDMPIHVYDLSTLSNEELTKAWSRTLNDTPCVVLFEDLDRTFDKDKNIGSTDKKSALTMDCLLNCINGVESSDGLLIFVTANDPSKLDSALGVPDATGKSTRPGRLDKIVFFGPLEEYNRREVAKRILSDVPDLIEDTVKSGGGETGAQFENRCVRIALDHYWGNSRVLAPTEETRASKLGITKNSLHVAKNGSEL